MTRPVYLDWNASTPLRPAAAAAVAAALGATGNPSSVHGFGRAARKTVDRAREQVAALAGVPASWVVFTSGGTEANNLALHGTGAARVLVSAIEHDSVLRAVPGAERIPVTAACIVDLAAFERLLAAGTGRALVSVMLANNETGAIQPVAEVAAIAKRHGALVHCDAVQAAGKIALDMRALGADLMSLSAHKLGGPQGVGALVVRPGIELAPLLMGGGQESWRRAGTENVSGIAGFGAAAEAARAGLESYAGIGLLRDELERGVRAQAPDSPIYGAASPRLANTSCLGMPGVKAETQVIALDLAGVAVSAGSACSSGKVAPSAVLGAMGAGEAAGQAIRASLGWSSTSEDVERFVAAWAALYRQTRESRKAA